MAVRMHTIPLNISRELPKRFERKFYIVPSKTGLAYGLLNQVCARDGEYPSEQINSLYFDTFNLDQYARSDAGDFRKDKIRIRWYGTEENLDGPQTIFIELKSREGFAGMKQRRKLSVPAENLEMKNLYRGIVPYYVLIETLTAFGYVMPGIMKSIVKISYWRYRFTDVMTGQRVSLDCHIRSTMIIPGTGNGERGLELPGAVLEIKGNNMELAPTLMHTRILDTDWTRFSKYSACIDAHYEQPGTIGRLAPSGRII